jgi:DNA-binding response OmpR family regulator
VYELGSVKMNVLIVESNRHIAELWRRALERLRVHVDIASSQNKAAETYDIFVLDLTLDEGSAF